jgi:DnaK suppressor protein
MTDDLRTALQDRQSELEAELSALAAPTTDTGGISFGKRVGDGTSIAVERITQVAAHDRLQQTLADVRRALAKLDDGTYGTCDSCGEPIPPQRLEARPWALRCVRCADMV